MRAWYVPSWNGDLRLEPNPKNAAETHLSIVSPTAGEKKILDAIQVEAVKQGWIEKDARAERSGLFWRRKKVVLAASIETVGPVVAKLMRPGPAVLTAISFTDGKIVTCSGSAAEIAEAVRQPDVAAHPYRDPPREVVPPVNPAEVVSAAAPAAAPAKPEVAATVKRHTPCCPQCVPGAVGPASEVLLSFLDEEQHESWAKTRSIVVEGGLSGSRYIIAHRHTEAARKFGRICYDVDADCVVHFHDWTVPPEEEVLAAKLILEHREPWLRNEATMLGAWGRVMMFKNPFGDGMDGTEDAAFTQVFGRTLGRGLGLGLH